jgi:ABC-type antimicrobial peptide transport system permease subunit
MPQVVRDIEWVGRISRTLANVLTCVAVLVATLGLYAVTSYAVSQRSQEIGIRIALGAKSRQVVWFEVRRIAKQLAIGLGTGWVLTRLWDAMFGTSRADVAASDPWPMLGVVAIVCVVAAVACYFPVRRATRLDPVAALRHE